MKTYGLIREIPYKNETIKFKASVGLLPLYKSLFGRDVIDDIISFMNGSKRFAQFVKQNEIIEQEVAEYSYKLESGQELTAEEMRRLETLDAALDEQIDKGGGLGIDTEFAAKLMCALALNAVPECERPGLPDALDAIPYEFTLDGDIIRTAIEMVLPFADVKKK